MHYVSIRAKIREMDADELEEFASQLNREDYETLEYIKIRYYQLTKTELTPHNSAKVWKSLN